MTKKTLDQVLRALSDKKTSLEKRTTAWAAKYEANPAHALSWATDAFQEAAQLELVSGVLDFLFGEVNPSFKGDRLECITSEFERDLLRMAASNPSSTSQCSNMMENCRRVVKAEMVQWLRGERGFW
jgi:hypothetical protein